MLKSKYEAKDNWHPKQLKESHAKRQSKNLSTIAEYKEDDTSVDILSWLD